MATLTHSPVHSDPQVTRGSLVFRACRAPAQTLLDDLDDGYTLGEFLEMFPSAVQERRPVGGERTIENGNFF